MIFYHLSDTVPALLFKVRILHILQRQPSCMILLPYQNSPLVAKIEKSLIIRVMACPDSIGPHILQQIHIMSHELQRNRTANTAIILMTIKSKEIYAFMI